MLSSMEPTSFVPGEMRQPGTRGAGHGARKEAYGGAEICLRQVEVGVANGKTLPLACKEVEIVEQAYYRWRKEYGGLKVDQIRQDA